jgi:DNA-binding MarR family transcriptional regulator
VRGLDQQEFSVADSEVSQPAKVIALKPAQASRASERKWGKDVMKLGFTIVPSLIFRAQERLGLNATQLAVLLQIADFWWDHNRKPYPSLKTLGDRLDLSQRQVARIVDELVDAKFVKKIERYTKGRGRMSNEYDLGGLVEKPAKLEPEFREVQEMKQKVARKGGLTKKAG